MKNNSKKIKLYWLHPHFYNWMGGHKYIYEVILRLKNDYDLDVILITSGLNETAEIKFKKNNIEIIKLFGFSTNSPLYWIFLPIFLLLEKMYLVYVKKIDRSALFISSMYPSNSLARKLSKNIYQLCYEPFAFFYDNDFINGFSFIEKVFIKFITICYKKDDRSAVKKNKKVFTISTYNKLWIKNAYNKHSLVIYEGVDQTFFKPTQNKIIEKKYKHNKVVFHSTDYTTIKGTKFLIEALPKVIKEVPSTRLVISETLPNSPKKQEIITAIREKNLESYIEFAGFLDYELLPAYLTTATVVVQPSINQSMNLTVKEAMACGTAVITSPEGKEQTANGVAGFLVKPTETSLLARRIIECLTDTDITRKMGRRGQVIIKNKFSWESVTKAIWEALKKE